jgi:hypothetical protein
MFRGIYNARTARQPRLQNPLLHNVTHSRGGAAGKPPDTRNAPCG